MVNPDHIATPHNATGEALLAAGDPAQYPELARYSVQASCISVFVTRQFMKLLVK